MQVTTYEVPAEGSPEARVLETYLPDSLKKLRAYLSLTDILRLVEAFGGGDVFIPTTPRDNSKLVDAIGEQAVVALAASPLRGDTLWVARAYRFKTELRNMEIVQLADLGESNASLAKAYGLTDRQILTILKNSR